MMQVSVKGYFLDIYLCVSFVKVITGIFDIVYISMKVRHAHNMTKLQDIDTVVSHWFLQRKPK